MNDYNYRQYVQMLKALQVNKLDIDTLGHVTGSLEALLALLENPDKEWTEQFQSEWGVLEQVYSYNMVEGKKSLNEQETEWVTHSLENLKQLIQMKLEISNNPSTQHNN